MADLVDLAQENDFNEYALKNIKRVVQRRGTCLYCYSELEGNSIFCDLDCRKDYEDEEKIRKTQGRK